MAPFVVVNAVGMKEMFLGLFGSRKVFDRRLFGDYFCCCSTVGQWMVKGLIRLW